jgi:hypothetical protein
MPLMITTSHAGGYQHAAEELVGIKRKALSVFVLHWPKKAELIAPCRLTRVYNRMSDVVSSAVHVIERPPEKGWGSSMQSMPVPESAEEQIRK